MITNKPLFVATDDGYAETKVISSEGHKIRLPSMVRAGIVLGSVSDEVHTYITNNKDGQEEKYTASMDNDNQASSTRFDSYPLSPENRVMIHHALRRAGLGGREIIIGTSLPLMDFFDGDGANNGLIESKSLNVIQPVRSSSDASLATISGSKVYPESVVAWIDFILNDSGDYRFSPSKPSVVVDIGGRTTDTSKILGGMSVQKGSSGTINVGVLNIFDELSQLMAKNPVLRREFPTLKASEIPRSMMQEVLALTYYDNRGDHIDLKLEVQTAKKNVASKILREVEGRISSGIDLQYLVFVGGGSALLKDEIASHYKMAEFVNEPEFANARGILKSLMFV